MYGSIRFRLTGSWNCPRTDNRPTLYGTPCLRGVWVFTPHVIPITCCSCVLLKIISCHNTKVAKFWFKSWWGGLPKELSNFHESNEPWRISITTKKSNFPFGTRESGFATQESLDWTWTVITNPSFLTKFKVEFWDLQIHICKSESLDSTWIVISNPIWIRESNPYRKVQFDLTWKDLCANLAALFNRRRT